MSREHSPSIVRLESAQAAIRDAFLGWQCRLRQLSVRDAEGRPTLGMRPSLSIAGAGDLGRITVLIVPREPAAATAELRHLVRRTHDPAERYKSALTLLSAHYYQYPGEFSDRLTALFARESAVAAAALRAGRCTLGFVQYSQSYRLPCAVMELGEDEPAYQLTFWHNSLFNPRVPPDARVVGFAPDWAHAEADPEVG